MSRCLATAIYEPRPWLTRGRLTPIVVGKRPLRWLLPTEKFAVQSPLAHLRGLEPVNNAQLCGAKCPSN